ncbi:MAG TPA: NfeD family protein [Acidimicrobiia bacterium]|nr:NfeD family protein [Acidimicrobiia bacterium]
MRTLRLVVLLAAVFLLNVMPALAQSEEGQVEFVDLSGILDERVLRFAIDSITAAAERGDTEVVVLQIDSPGVVGSEETLLELIELTSSPPLPVVTWIGPAPARAYGGAGLLALTADLRFAAPGSEIGHLGPTVAGGSTSVGPEHLLTAVVEVEAEALLEVSETTAAPRQLVQLLDGRSIRDATGEHELSTLVPFEGGETVAIVVRSPGWWDGFLRLASTPEAVFFFLVAGLTVAAFEFYAIGPGIAAGVAAVSLFLASYGVAVLPMRWWAVALTLASVWVLAASYQKGNILGMNILGLAGLTVAGFSLTDAAPQFSPGVPGVLLTLAAAAFFFFLAMPTVARSRFSTQTIGRDHLIGRTGVAVSALEPDGLVEVDGARWRASAHREAGIGANDPVVVTAVEGWFLEVAPPD